MAKNKELEKDEKTLHLRYWLSVQLKKKKKYKGFYPKSNLLIVCFMLGNDS